MAGVLILLISSPAFGQIKAKIIDGTRVDPVNSPFVKVYFSSEEGTNWFCSGTLVTPTKVLTAAHCVIKPGFVLKRATVVFDNIFQVVTLRVASHPKYKNTLNQIKHRVIRHDLAVLTLPFSPHGIIPVDVLNSFKVQPKDLITIYGYGYSNTGGYDLLLRTGRMRVESSFTRKLDTFYASGYKNKRLNACYGDSGGPAIATIELKADKSKLRTIVGVTSTTVLGCVFSYNGFSSTAEKSNKQFLRRELR